METLLRHASRVVVAIAKIYVDCSQGCNCKLGNFAGRAGLARQQLPRTNDLNNQLFLTFSQPNNPHECFQYLLWMSFFGKRKTGIVWLIWFLVRSVFCSLNFNIVILVPFSTSSHKFCSPPQAITSTNIDTKENCVEEKLPTGESPPYNSLTHPRLLGYRYCELKLRDGNASQCLPLQRTAPKRKMGKGQVIPLPESRSANTP